MVSVETRRALLTIVPLGLALPLACRGTSEVADSSPGDNPALVETFNDLTPTEEYGDSTYVVAPEDDLGAVDEEPDLTDDVVVDELGDEGAVADVGGDGPDTSVDTATSVEESDIGAAGERADCGLEVVATSPAAVADPCATTDDFMRSLGLSEDQMTQVRARSELP